MSTPTTDAPSDKTASPSPTAPRRASRIPGIGSAAGRYMVPILFVALTLYFVITLPNFRTQVNFVSMADSQSIVLMLAIIGCFLLRIGEFDLSIISTMVLAGAIVAKLTEGGTGLFVALLVAIAAGVVVGVINGLLVVRLGVDAFVTTLGINTLTSGLIYWITDSSTLLTVPDPIVSLSRDHFLGLTLVTWIGWAFVLVAWYIFDFTPLGRRMLFIGGSRDVARLAGIAVDRTRFLGFIVAGVLASIVGVLLLGQLGAADGSTTAQYLLPPFAAVFLGAATIRLNQFNALGTLFALYLLAVGVTGLQLNGAPTWVSSAFNGAALVAAVTLAKLASRSKAAA
ncbi:MAG: ABC transporter permease [Aeromicrobium sp.]